VGVGLAGVSNEPARGTVPSGPAPTATYPRRSRREESDVSEFIHTPLGVADVAKALGVGRTTVYALVRDGAIKHARVGNLIRFNTAWVEEYLRRVTVDAVPPANHPDA
jgi:excisionase family DNA binding protein